MRAVPTLRLERQLLRDGVNLLAGMDEVGRGALGGPVSVGVVLVDLTLRSGPVGLRDSKLLTPDARAALAPRIRRWVKGHAVGHASAAEIDSRGIIAALRLAGERALAALPSRPDLVLLDGSHNWLTPPPVDLFTDALADAPEFLAPPVTTRVKADLTCASVAAASVLAKTTRDALMVDLAQAHPEYDWAANKGYASPAHQAALRAIGPCQHHRRSWNITEREELVADYAAGP